MMRTLLTTYVALLAAACSGTPSVRPALDVAPFRSFDTATFPGAATILSGFAPADDDPAMRVGDAALLGIELYRGGTVQRQLLLLEVNAIPIAVSSDGSIRMRPTYSFTLTERTMASADAEEKVEQRTWPLHAVKVRLIRHDANGAVLRDSVARLFEEPLAAGWWPDTEAQAPTREKDMVGALSSSLQELANTDSLLQHLLFSVVDGPSIWSIATNLGVKVVLAWQVSSGGPSLVDGTGFADEVRAALLEVRVNGDTALWMDMFVTRPNGATMVCGGLVGAIARHPTEPGRMAVVRLLATRRGPPPGQ